MQIPGYGDAAAVIHAVVAAQAGADVVFAAFLRFSDDLGVGHGGTGHEHIVGLSLCQHFFRHGRVIDAAHKPDGNPHAGLFHDLACPCVVRHGLEAGGVLLGTSQSVDAVAAGDMGHVNIRFKNLQLFGAFFRGDAAFNRVAAVDAQFNEQIVAHGFPDCPDHHQREAAAVLDGTAEFVAAVVGERREKVVEQPAMPVVQQDAVKVGDLRPVGIFCEQRGDFFQIFPRGGPGTEMGFVVRGNFLEPRAHVGAAVHVLDKGLAVEGMHRALEALEVHLVAGFGVQIEHVFMTAVDRHFHGQGHAGEAALDVAHPVVDAEGVDAAVAVLAAAGGPGADGRDVEAVVEANPVPADIQRFKQMGILFLVDGFHCGLLAMVRR